MVVAVVPFPAPAGVALYWQVGGSGGGDGGADGGWQVPSQSTMYSTYTKLPSYGYWSTASVAVVTNVYMLSGLAGSETYLAQTKKPRASTTAPSDGLHLPCTSSPLAVVLTMYSSASSKSVSFTSTVR